MEPIKSLNMRAIERRITKSTTTEKALRDVTPFILETNDKNTKIIVDKDKKNV